MLSKSESLFNRARNVIPSGVNSPVRFYEPYPFFAVSANGSKIVTADHKICIDYCMGYGAVLLGHAYQTVTESIKNQLDIGSLYCVPTEKEVKLAELIAEIVPCAEMTRLVTTGAEATMNAIRLARAFTKKKKILKFDGSYHGSYDYVLINAGSGAESFAQSDGSIEEVTSQTLVIPYNDSEQLDRVIAKNDDIACVIIEPIFANMGLILPKEGYLNDVRKITRQNDIILIFDEVVTGFRIALGGASEFFGIKPDLATLAKSMGNGFPVAAIAGKKEIMQQLAPAGRVYQASTYAGNPTSVSASISTIETLIRAKNDIYPTIAKTSDRLVNGIKDELEDAKLNLTLNTIGSMYQLFFTEGRVTDANSAKKSNAANFRLLFDELLKRGVFIPPSQFETCFVSYSHSEDDVYKTIEFYGDALRRVKETR
jgi:glutamate-1-semialdehyde 2,1-aminomutase